MYDRKAAYDRSAEWNAAGLDFDVKNQVGLLTMNRPGLKNAVNRDLRNAILEALDFISLNPEIRAGLITGAGGAFCSGADLAQTSFHDLPAEYVRGTHTHHAREDGLRFGWWRLIERVWTNSKPIVAAVNGPAYGFGCNFAFAADLVIAGESARFCEVFVRRGLPIEAGGAYLLPRSISLVRAKELALFGDPLTGKRAEEWGLVNHCVPDEEVLPLATEWAERLARGPTIDIGHIKSQINLGLDQTIQQVWRDEVTFLGIGSGDDSQEALRAFQEKREPRFSGK